MVALAAVSVPSHFTVRAVGPGQRDWAVYTISPFGYELRVYGPCSLWEATCWANAAHYE